MPRLAEFYGIVIAMYWRDHHPPHFHAKYAGDEAEIGIDPVRILEGDLPRRARRLVFEWAELHQNELAENWHRARNKQPLESIPPLD